VRGRLELGGILVAVCVLAGTGARAQEPAPPAPTPPPAEADERPTGLPSGVDWTFNIDASWGSFGFANSLYTDPKPDQPSGDLGDQWFEGSVKPALSATYTDSTSWQLYGKISAVGERTYGAAPSLVGEDASSFKAEDLQIGWRSGKSLTMGENALEFTLGRAQYRLGHGFLVYDGAAEGGNRGGYWTNARKAFQFAAIGRFKPGHHTLEGFYLDKDDLPEADTGTRLWGVNYEYALGESSSLGVTYLKTFAHPENKPQRDGLNVYNARAFLSPIPSLKALSVEVELAREDNGDALHSFAWNLLLGYQFATKWKPKVSYRYAFFEGDDPATPANEAFDPLLLGFYDWGTWWQGEIAGEYFVSNSNLVSHQVRLHLAPNDSIGTGLFFYKFLLDRPEAVDPQLTARDVAFEVDWYMDWKLNSNFTLSLIAAFADPGAVVEQAFGRTKNFSYGMIYLGYSY
jgi:alginate export protein